MILIMTRNLGSHTMASGGRLGFGRLKTPNSPKNNVASATSPTSGSKSSVTSDPPVEKPADEPASTEA